MNLTAGIGKSASGVKTLASGSSGSSDTVSGANALQGNMTGDYNTACEESALGQNTTSNRNARAAEVNALRVQHAVHALQLWEVYELLARIIR